MLLPAGLTPHGFCLAWNPGLLWLHVSADTVIACSYYSIPLALAWFLRRRRDLEFGWMGYLFAAFILSCGTTHWLSILTLWQPAYWLDGAVKASTAILSLFTAIMLWPLLAKAVHYPAPNDLRRVNQELSLRIGENDRTALMLQESEARHRSIYRRTPVPLHVLDCNGRLTGVSDYWCDLLGYSLRDVIGRPLTDFCAKETAAVMKRRFGILLVDDELRERECIFVKKDGGELHVLLSARLERDGLGRPLHILGVLTDVTGHRLAEQALRASEERLFQSQKLEAIGKLTGGISHDFNNMLTVIDGNLELLKPRLGRDAASMQLVDSALGASARAEQLTAQLLAFSRRQRLTPIALQPRHVIEGMSTLLLGTAGETSLMIDAGDATAWFCLADRNQLEAALLSLVTNAAHAVRARPDVQGLISIAVQNRHLDASEAAVLAQGDAYAVKPGDHVSIIVSDNGVGMGDNTRRRALEPFFTTRPFGDGTGLGLSQTYGFVSQSGGAMTIASEIGKGTRIELFLPRTSAVPGLAEPAVTPISGADPMRNPKSRVAFPRQQRILVVEDEPNLLAITAESLRAGGYAVVCAADGTIALDALAADQSIALIFTDIVMPGITGVALAEQALLIRPGIPVIFASGYSEAAIIEQIPKDAPFLKKPYRISQVTSLIQAALPENQLTGT